MLDKPFAECDPFELFRFDGGSTSIVRGRVLNGAAQPPDAMTDVQIELRREDGGRTYFLRSGADGGFDFGSVPEGSYILSACIMGWDTNEVPVTIHSAVPAKSLEIWLKLSESGGIPDVIWSTGPG